MVNRFGRPEKRRLSKPDNDLPGYVNAAVSLNRYQVVALIPSQISRESRRLLILSLNTSLLLIMCATRQVSYIRCRTCINVTTVTTTWTHIKSSPSIVITATMMYLKMAELGLAQRAPFRTVSHAPPTGEQCQTTTTTWQRIPDRIVLLIHAAITGTNAQKRVSLDSPRNKPGTVPTIILTVNDLFGNLQFK